MKKNFLFFLICCVALQAKEVSCESGAYPARITLRHIEPNGIGYSLGYTTLEVFLAARNGSWTPFLDVRGHLFDNGKPAANVGMGARMLAQSRLWGANVFYDYRKTIHQTYNQIALGLETLGQLWDVRLNGYIPVGSKLSGFYHTRFGGFSGTTMLVSRTREFCLKGVNAEAGVHVDQIPNIPVYFAAGPYYLTGKGASAWGGEARVRFDFFRYLQVEGNVSYDSLFKWIGQGQLGLTLPFGSRSKVSYCSPARFTRNLALSERAVQRVDRNEIIPVDTKKYYASAINPLTGLPYTFWFVNNLSHSAGTFESPFPTLADAIAASSVDEIIMVYTGDGTSNGLNAGAAPFALKDHQQLLGAGFEYSFPTQYGTVMLPALDQGRPYLTANQDVSGVSLAERNTVSGLLIQITDTSSGSITAGIYNNPNINQTKIFNNSFILHGYAYAASLVNCGNVTISQNSVQGESNSTGFDVFDANQSINISGNTISGCSNKAGIHVEGIVTHCAISDNSVRNCGTGIDFYPSSVSDVLIENNLTSNCATGISDITLGNGVETHQILGNTISDSSLIALTFDADGASSGVITVSSNTITGTGVTGLLVDVDNTANILLHVTNNSIYAGSIGSSVESHGNSTICFRFQDNQGNLSTQLTQNHPSLFQLEPYTGNTMPLSWTGTITNVSQSTCN